MAAPPFPRFADSEKCPLSKLPHSRVRAPTLALVPLLRDVTCLSFLGPRRSYYWTNCPLTSKVLSGEIHSPLEDSNYVIASFGMGSIQSDMYSTPKLSRECFYPMSPAISPRSLLIWIVMMLSRQTHP